MANYNWPINPTTVNSGPVQFEIDGIPTVVNVDTGTPANSTPLPVRLYDHNGNVLSLSNNYGASAQAIRTASQIGNATGSADFNAGNVSAQTLRTVIATDQPAIPTRAPVNTNGSYDEITTLDTTPQTFTVPAEAVGFVLETWSSNSVNIRYKIGSAASSASGMVMEPGRDTGYIPCSANISVAAESGTNQSVSVQWILRV